MHLYEFIQNLFIFTSDVNQNKKLSLACISPLKPPTATAPSGMTVHCGIAAIRLANNGG